MSSTRVSIYRALAFVMEQLPERVDVAIARSLARLVGSRGNRSVHLRRNLTMALRSENVLPTDGLVTRVVERAWQSYGQYWAEGAKLPALSRGIIVDRFTISEGESHLRAAQAAGRGVIVALPHVGSWEWGGSYFSTLGFTMTAVAEELEPPELFEWFRAKRESMGIRIEPLNDRAGTTLLDVLRGGGVVGLLCDRDLQGNGVDVEFFGQRVTMPAGPATLALRTGATLLAAACYAGPGRDHHAVVCAPVVTTRQGRLREDVSRVTQLIAQDLEGLIRRAPEQWHVLQPIFPAS